MNPDTFDHRTGLLLDDDQARALLEGMDDAVFRVDFRGVIQWCNPASARLMGVDARYLVGCLIWEALNLESRTGQRLRGEDFLPVRRTSGGQESARTEWLLIHPAEGVCSVRMTVMPLGRPGEDDGPGALIVLGTRPGGAPVTDAGTSDLINTVSHEMRSPITSILGLTGLMLDREVPAEKARRYIRVIHEDATRLRLLVDDLMDYQRLAGRRHVYRLAPVSLPELIQRVVDGMAGAGGIHPITVDAPAGLPAVLGDADGLRRVLDNLISNAVKYSPDGGAIEIRASVRGEEVEVTVRDWGRGFDPADRDKLFERFFRLPDAGPGTVRGSGLGLAIVKEIVQSLDGRVWACSDGVGRGSTFGFALAAAGREH